MSFDFFFGFSVTILKVIRVVVRKKRCAFLVAIFVHYHDVPFSKLINLLQVNKYYVQRSFDIIIKIFCFVARYFTGKNMSAFRARRRANCRVNKTKRREKEEKMDNNFLKAKILY